MATHDGHRQRMRERFLNDGLEGFREHEILELLLYYCIPRKNTNETAHNLIKHFGSFSKVMDAPVKELMKVEGMGEHAAVFLTLLREVNKYYHINRLSNDEPLSSLDACGKYMVPFFATQNNECVYLLSLDAKCRPISCKRVSEGSINSTAISTRKIVDVALTENATTVVLAHNHPGGVAVPSKEDVDTTYRVASALAMVDVLLIDHVIVADGDHVSLRRSNMYDPDEMYTKLNG